MFGPKYEVVFHSLIRIRLIWKPLRIAMLADGPFPPLSSFGSSLLQDKVYLDKDFVFNYKAVADSEKSFEVQLISLKWG